jgi:hypothetical protein
MHCALFQTNLPILHWSVSSGLINLLVVRLAMSLHPDCPPLSKPRSVDQIVSYSVQRPSITRRGRDPAEIWLEL